MSWREEYEREYKTMRAGARRVTGELLERLVKTAQTNAWLKTGGAEFEPEGLCVESDYPWCLELYEDIGLLQKFFEHGNWGIRAAVQHKDLIFVNQINGGDEWWTLKIDGERLVPFESITMCAVIQHGTFNELIDGMHKATVEQCRSLDYEYDTPKFNFKETT